MGNLTVHYVCNNKVYLTVFMLQYMSVMSQMTEKDDIL
jgi:hypothetical protein